jgi:dienelactone hydrolase
MTNVTSPNPPRSRLARWRWRRAAAWSCAVLVALLVVLAATLVGPVLRDPTAGFAARKGRLAGVEVRAATRQGSSTVTELRLVADSGLAVDLTVRVPDGPVSPRPTVLILGGRGTGRDAARLGGDIGDVVVAALSYPFAGDTTAKGVRAVLRIRRVQRAVLDTVPAILLATDYLLEQPYIDANRLELIGVSLGAFLVSPAGVLDKRIRRVWIVHGASNPASVIDYGLRDRVGIRPLRRMIAAIFNVLVAGRHLAPELWVGRISPRPVIAINARDDGRLPRASVDALHAALKDPYEIVWMDGPHVLPNRAEVIEILCARILERVSYEAIPVGSVPQNVSGALKLDDPRVDHGVHDLHFSQ